MDAVVSPGEAKLPEVQPHAAEVLSREQLKEAAQVLIKEVDLQTMSLGVLRTRLCDHFGLEQFALDSRRGELKDVFTECVDELLARRASQAPREDTELGEERADASRSTYLVTAPHTQKETSEDGYKLNPPGSSSREQICALMLAALAALQSGRSEPLTFIFMAIFLEKHAAGEVHYHIAVLADRNFRFNPFKKELLKQGGLATHWSCTHSNYASCVRYCYLPSLKKQAEQLDPQPLLWPETGDKPHPPLSQASQPPVTAAATAVRREKDRLKRAAKGQGEAKFRDVDLWPVVIQENIPDDETAAERVMLYAKRCGGHSMVQFCFHNWDRLPALVARSWKVEKVEEYITQHDHSRVDILRKAAGVPCVCGGQWLSTALNTLTKNDIDPCEWTDAVWQAFVDGRAKGNLVCHAGIGGNEGKSFFWRPLVLIFGEEGVFVAPPKSGFPLMGLERARVTLLDDWRFNEDIVSYALQLLWFEGAPFVISRPQNAFSGHLRYNKDDPVFVTTLEADIRALKGKRFLKEGDIEMMLKRLRIFLFKTAIAIPKKLIKGCPCCFARLVLGLYPQYQTCRGGQKRQAGSGLTQPPLAKRANEEMDGEELLGMSQLVGATRLPLHKAAALEAEILGLGAVHVRELTIEDWQGLSTWAQLGPFEQRRVRDVVSTQ